MNPGRKIFYKQLDIRRNELAKATGGLGYADLGRCKLLVPVDDDGLPSYLPSKRPFLIVDPPLPHMVKDRKTKQYVNRPLERTNVFSMPSKMAAFGFSLPPGPTSRKESGSCPASSFDTGDPLFICNACYALDGNYLHSQSIMKSQLIYAWTKHMVESGWFATTMHYLLQDVWHNTTRPAQTMRLEKYDESGRKYYKPIWFHDSHYFRIHDAGDFYSEKYFRAWAEIADKNRDTLFWAPTRVALDKDGRVNREWVKVLRNRPDNLIVRPSTLHFEARPPRIPGLDAGTMCSINKQEESTGVHDCPVYWHDEYDTCEDADCRVCWDQPDREVCYPAHGKTAKRLYKIVYGEDFEERLVAPATLGDLDALVDDDDELGAITGSSDDDMDFALVEED